MNTLKTSRVTIMVWIFLILLFLGSAVCRLNDIASSTTTTTSSTSSSNGTVASFIPPGMSEDDLIHLQEQLSRRRLSSDSTCNLTRYQQWLNEEYSGVLASDSTFWIYQTQSQIVLNNFFALNLAVRDCTRMFQQLTYYRAGRMGPVTVQDAYKIMCRTYCLQSDEIHQKAMNVSGCSCLELSTQEDEVAYKVPGDWCSHNTARLLCDQVGYCGVWDCRIDDFMCPRYEWNKKVIPYKGPGTCVRGSASRSRMMGGRSHIVLVVFTVVPYPHRDLMTLDFQLTTPNYYNPATSFNSGYGQQLFPLFIRSQVFPSPSKETDAISSVDDVVYDVEQEQEQEQAAGDDHDKRLNLQSHIEEDLGLDFLPPASQEQEEKLRHYESLLGSFDRLVGWEVSLEDLGMGYIKSVIGLASSTCLTLVKLHDGRELVVALLLELDGEDGGDHGIEKASESEVIAEPSSENDHAITSSTSTTTTSSSTSTTTTTTTSSFGLGRLLYPITAGGYEI
eukprot:scaffold3161_cov247-Ochromonas_danica.AAC.5